MGNNIPCPRSAASKDCVPVMREDGTLLKFKKGVHAKEVMDSHPGRVLLRCGSNRAPMPATAELEGKRLYFLVAETGASLQEAYEKMWQLCESKGLVRRSNQRNGNERCVVRRCTWTPELKTIPEVTSPPVVSGN